jgi:beta-N-acetylhexosaminidase
VKKTIGLLMVDVGGPRLTAEDRELLAHPLVGGVILFARNYVDPPQLQALCGDLLALKQPRLLLAVDHEGGRVQRFRVGFSRAPAMGALGALWREDPVRAQNEARHWGGVIATELGAYGIDLCFAPVLDLDHGVSQIIGDRAFAGDAEPVVALARAFRAGLRSAGMAATGKHFPGHGAVAPDSHLELPVDRRAWDEIAVVDLEPFRALIADGIESLMMAHVRYEQVDTLPASLSRRWVNGILRRKLGFRGAVFCDDLSMHGAAVVGDVAQRAHLALQAGCDMLPVCNDRPAVVTLLDALPVQARGAAGQRLAALQLQPGGSAV